MLSVLLLEKKVFCLSNVIISKTFILRIVIEVELIDENILVELDLGFSLYWVNGFQITTEEDVVVLFTIVFYSILIISCCCIHITVFKNQSPST